MTSAQRWIELEGAENVRDLGGLPTVDGSTIRPGRLIRSDSLQALAQQDVRRLVDDLHVTAVADLRTGVEVAGEGPGPMTHEPGVEIRHLSLFTEPEDGVELSDDADKPIVLPWKERDRVEHEQRHRPGVSGVYLGYLDDRPDSVLAALRLIAHTEGSTIVHCAAGKDRTGTVIALALAEVGVSEDDIVDDYVLSAERVEAVLRRLATRRTYAGDLVGDEPVDKHKPKAETMRRLLAAIDEAYGGVPAWLRAHGWTDDDAAALRAKLLAD
jgi:protein-tyrosine phosphatase